MKKISVILTLALCISNMHAQEAYLSIFGQEQAEWDYVYYRNRSEISATSASFGVYTADTIVLDSGIYRPYWMTRMTEPFVLDASRNPTRISPGDTVWLRETEDRSRLYRRIHKDAEDELVMDLNWQKGDTIQLWDTWLRQSPDVVVIDSVYYADNIKHLLTNHYLRFHYDGETPEVVDTLKFIEGVGPTIGIMHFEHGNDLVPLLACYSRDDAWLPGYQASTDPRFTMCQPVFPDRIDSIGATPQIYVTPSVAHERIRISGVPTGSIRIEIFNSLGHPVHASECTGPQADIDISDLVRGLYMVRISGSAVSATKFIKP